jgi:nucleotide-binding universal stress UspA family protein
MKISKILIAIDDSKHAEHAAEYGFELAHFYKAQVGLVNIVEPIITPAPGTDMITGTMFEPGLASDTDLIKVQKEVSESVIQRTIKSFAGDLQVTYYTEYGSTSDGIINCCNEFNADLIVIGTHSRTGIDRLLMGSVAESVVRHSPVPVLVVPFRESESQ